MESTILDGAGAGGLSITDNTKYLGFWAQHGGGSHNGSALGTRSNHDLGIITNDTKRMVIMSQKIINLHIKTIVYTLFQRKNSIS